MPDLTTKDIDRLEQRLLKRRDELRWIIHDALLDSRREDYVELATQVHDAGEESVAALIEGLNHAALDREVEEVQDVEAALERIKAATYGTCVDCGDAIDGARLDAYPTAKRCLRCQSAHEGARRGGKDYTPSL
jgi:RNA polymerase-binding transcription factor DksA